MNEKIVVCGAGGFIGGKMVEFLVRKGYTNIRAVSRKPVSQWLKPNYAVENCSLDLRTAGDCFFALEGAKIVYNFAASVGGIGYIGAHNTDCMLSSLINTHLLCEAKRNQVMRYFFASSSCVYPDSESALRESDAYPAQPTTEYGWEKLFSERMCLNFERDCGVPVTIARLHTLYGPGDVRPPGRDHVVAALCRKVAEAKLAGKNEINIWGDGTQTRSLLYIDDCIEGIYRLVNRGVRGPVNLANSEVISVNQLVFLLEEIAGIQLMKFYSPNAPVGCPHKFSDNGQLRRELSWEPMTSIRDGLAATYRDTYDRLLKK